MIGTVLIFFDKLFIDKLFIDKLFIDQLFIDKLSSLFTTHKTGIVQKDKLSNKPIFADKYTEHIHTHKQINKNTKKRAKRWRERGIDIAERLMAK